VIAGVRDRQPTFDVGRQAAREPEPARRTRLQALAYRSRFLIQSALPFMLSRYLLYEFRQPLVRQLTRLLTDDVTLRIDDRKRRPARDRVVTPDPQLSIVDDRMIDPETFTRRGDCRRLALVPVLTAVDSDDDNAIRVLTLEPPDPRKHVDAVDSTIGPEVEHHDPPSQIVPRGRPGHVQPIEAVSKRRRMDDLSVHLLAVVFAWLGVTTMKRINVIDQLSEIAGQRLKGVFDARLLELDR
jgi:hypothetical protein